MSRYLSQQKAMFTIAKMFVAQYLQKMHDFSQFQEGAVDLLTHYMIKVIRQLALKVKRMLDLQGRFLSNPLHLLAVGQMNGIIDFQKLLEYILKMKKVYFEEFTIIEKYSQRLLGNDIRSLNNYQKCTEYRNISHIPSVYTYDISKGSLPYRHPIHQVIPKPLESSYKGTKKIIVPKTESIEILDCYTKRMMNRSIAMQRHYDLEYLIKKKKREEELSHKIFLKRQMTPKKTKNNSQDKLKVQVKQKQPEKAEQNDQTDHDGGTQKGPQQKHTDQLENQKQKQIKEKPQNKNNKQLLIPIESTLNDISSVEKGSYAFHSQQAMNSIDNLQQILSIQKKNTDLVSKQSINVDQIFKNDLKSNKQTAITTQRKYNPLIRERPLSDKQIHCFGQGENHQKCLTKKLKFDIISYL